MEHDDLLGLQAALLAPRIGAPNMRRQIALGVALASLPSLAKVVAVWVLRDGKLDLLDVREGGVAIRRGSKKRHHSAFAHVMSGVPRLGVVARPPSVSKPSPCARGFASDRPV